ncbi:MAG: tRNA-(ms[2]io[6]A)-hydroxylase [Bacteroidetes bacterium]|nr:tRNA-(ms[2]io[6]A)-hydroxylase [Bacteroidota bacterium]
MLGLKLPTDPRWADLASLSIEEILTDHAYCEQKATSTAISLIQTYPEYEEMVEALIPIVNEEWGHFKMVLEELKKRDLKLGQQRKDVYVNKLNQFVKRGDSRLNQLLERLLFSALIEARSCERFKILSQNIQDDELKLFYKMLMVSEAGHFKLFLDLAYLYAPREVVNERWEAFLEYEAEVIRGLELRGDRVH